MGVECLTAAGCWAVIIVPGTTGAAPSCVIHSRGDLAHEPDCADDPTALTGTDAPTCRPPDDPTCRPPDDTGPGWLMGMKKLAFCPTVMGDWREEAPGRGEMTVLGEKHPPAGVVDREDE